MSSGRTPVREEIAVAPARGNLSAIGRRMKDQYRSEVDLNDAPVAPLADAMVGDVRTLSFSWEPSPSALGRIRQVVG
jgi:hypothetical protein